MTVHTARSVRTWLDRRRRWRRNLDPPPTPDGWTTAPPDFVGVGVEKAGTSWWYELLVDHPEVQRPLLAHKELRFFNRFATQPFGEEDVERYASLFARPRGMRCGEWTPSYVSDYWVPPLLRRCAPDTRLLVILRDPVERFVSGLAQSGASGQADSPVVRRRAFERGCYASQLERLWRSFPPAQTLVLQYEACVDLPQRHLRESYRFVGLDPDFVPDSIERPVHATAQAKPILDTRMRTDLTSAYSAEVERLGRLCPDLDLDRWSTPN